MLPKVLLHKRNGHRQGPDTSDLSPGEILRLVHSDRPTALSVTGEQFKFAQIAETEKSAPESSRLPLSEALARTQAAFDQGELADVQASLDALEAQADVAARMITQLVTTARRPGGNARPNPRRRLVNLNEITQDALASAGPRLGGVRLESRLDPGLPWIVADHRQLQQAVATLVCHLACLSADSDTRGTITVSTARRDSVVQGENLARICIRVERTAIPEHVLKTLFRVSAGPWVAGNVAEMDLYVASRIVGEHGGLMAAGFSPEGDPCFTLDFPGI